MMVTLSRFIALGCFLLAGLVTLVAAGKGLDVTVTLRGKKYEIKDASSVSDLQSSLEEQAGLAKDQQSVLFKGKLLTSGDNLSEAGVAAGDTINVVPSKKPKSSSAAATVGTDGQTDGALGTEDPFASLSGLGGMGGIPGLPDDMTMEKYQGMMQEMMNSPMMDEFLGDPQKIEEARQAILGNPMLMQAMNNLPGFADMVQDEEKWRESMMMAKDMYEQQKNLAGDQGAGGAADVDDLDDE